MSIWLCGGLCFALRCFSFQFSGWESKNKKRQDNWKNVDLWGTFLYFWFAGYIWVIRLDSLSDYFFLVVSDGKQQREYFGGFVRLLSYHDDACEQEGGCWIYLYHMITWWLIIGYICTGIAFDVRRDKMWIKCSFDVFFAFFLPGILACYSRDSFSVIWLRDCCAILHTSKYYTVRTWLRDNCMFPLSWHSLPISCSFPGCSPNKDDNNTRFWSRPALAGLLLFALYNHELSSPSLSISSNTAAAVAATHHNNQHPHLVSAVCQSSFEKDTNRHTHSPHTYLWIVAVGTHASSGTFTAIFLFPSSGLS